MKTRAFRQLLTALLLGPGLTLSSAALAEHLHDNFNDELSCETCRIQGTGIVPDENCGTDTSPEEVRVVKERPRIPFETFRLGERQRGLPLH